MATQTETKEKEKAAAASKAAAKKVEPAKTKPAPVETAKPAAKRAKSHLPAPKAGKPEVGKYYVFYPVRTKTGRAKAASEYEPFIGKCYELKEDYALVKVHERGQIIGNRDVYYDGLSLVELTEGMAYDPEAYEQFLFKDKDKEKNK